MTSTSKSIVESAIKWARGLFGTALLTSKLTLTPVPAARPRVGRWGTYYPKKYAAWKAAAEAEALTFKQADKDGLRLIVLDCVIEKPRTSKLDTPNGDVDNFAKGPLDALNRAAKAWHDDKQVMGLLAFKRFAEKGEEPGTNIGVWHVE